jgi:hypothetical protein
MIKGEQPEKTASLTAKRAASASLELASTTWTFPSFFHRNKNLAFEDLKLKILNKISFFIGP